MLAEPIGHGMNQRSAAFAVDRSDGEYRTLPPVGSDKSGDPHLPLILRKEIELVQHQPARLLVERLVIALELLDDRASSGDGVGGAVERREIHDMEQQTSALQMPQKAVTEPRTFRGALDQSRDIGDHEAAAFVGAHHAEMRYERGEWIVGHAWTRGGDRPDQCGLARV